MPVIHKYYTQYNTSQFCICSAEGDGKRILTTVTVLPEGRRSASQNERDKILPSGK